MPTEELAIIDTNVLLYATDRSAPQHAASVSLRTAGEKGEVKLAVTPQIMFEYVGAITNPRRVKNAINLTEAWANVEAFIGAFVVLSPGATQVDDVMRLSQSLGVAGAEIHDLAIAATALQRGVSTVYSYDARVFSRVPGLTVRTP